MCSYTYSWYYCNHDYYIWSNTIEVCPNRLLTGYSPDTWSVDMCKNMKVTCGGFSNYYCHDCSEDVSLEYELDEIRRHGLRISGSYAIYSSRPNRTTEPPQIRSDPAKNLPMVDPSPPTTQLTFHSSILQSSTSPDSGTGTRQSARPPLSPTPPNQSSNSLPLNLQSMNMNEINDAAYQDDLHIFLHNEGEALV